METIVTVVYRQGHLVLGFQHTSVEFVLGFFVGTPTLRGLEQLLLSFCTWT